VATTRHGRPAHRLGERRVPFPEDSPAQTFAILGNDTNAAGGTVALTSTPGLGTAVLDPLTNLVTYTPRLNAFGNDSFTYTVTVGAVVSNTATVAITITNVNDTPVAANDGTFTVRVGVATALPNLLANDTDPDGATDLVAAASLTAPTPAALISAVRRVRDVACRHLRSPTRSAQAGGFAGSRDHARHHRHRVARPRRSTRRLGDLDRLI
jgi:hypothetical protein